MGGQVNFSSSGWISPVPPTGGNPTSSLKHQQTSFKLYLLQESNPQLAKSKWALYIYTQSKIERAFVSFFLLKTFCLMKELPEGYIHEIKYQENCRYLLIFLKKNKIQRVTRSHFIAFSKWAKVECYIDLMVTVSLLFKDSLKSQTWLFSYRNLQDLQWYSDFLTVSKSEGYSPFIELLWGLHILEILYKNWVPSINEK